MEREEKLKQLAYQMGFDWVSIGSSEPLEKDSKRYQEWCKLGFAADLSYMIREYPRRWVPQDLMSGAKSIITFAVQFSSGPKYVDPKPGYGRVARYAWGKDYHEVIRRRIEEWIEKSKSQIGVSFKSKILVDSSPLLERAAARQTGTGFIGKNTLLISRKIGSYLFLAEVLVDLSLEPDKPVDSLGFKDDCGSCRECQDACPTGALVTARFLDARKCISYWTIEHRGEIPEPMREGIGDWIFGCDICQEVCPYNGIVRDTKWKELAASAGTGPYLSLMEVLAIREDKDFKNKFAGTPILRSKRSGLIRNACIVSGNQKFEPAVPILKECLEMDVDPAIRSHAHWALEKILN